jgi:hypothetical protein
VSDWQAVFCFEWQLKEAAELTFGAEALRAPRGKGDVVE